MKIKRRGFKLEAHAYAREFREELGLPVNGPLCPWDLANLLEIPIIPLSRLRKDASKAVGFLMGRGRSEFFGVTCSFGNHRTILHNDGNAETRQRSDLAHELSHAILAHPPSPPFNERGERTLDSELEKEATWLGGALLVSEEATLSIVRSGETLESAAKRFGVSVQLIRMRINFTGARRRVA